MNEERRAQLPSCVLSCARLASRKRNFRGQTEFPSDPPQPELYHTRVAPREICLMTLIGGTPGSRLRLSLIKPFSNNRPKSFER
jgi:hypothetical protein